MVLLMHIGKQNMTTSLDRDIIQRDVDLVRLPRDPTIDTINILTEVRSHMNPQRKKERDYKIDEIVNRVKSSRHHHRRSRECSYSRYSSSSTNSSYILKEGRIQKGRPV